jgi:hypothetical protein
MFRRWFLGAAASVLVAGCLSPTLPLPPPSAPDIQEVGSGQYVLTGIIPEPGFVLVLNKRTNAVNGTLSSGEYSVPVQARPADAMQLWYESGTDVSDIVEFEIPAESRSTTPADAGASPSGN